ncbi:hypothetical protein E3E26_06240 [Thermococcus sp. LS1]|uniref:hypothetical protein n=1 Tax=Thermococcus sp. LS1 TaxID=1638259 RepID=UPI00143B9AD3|nr:hypothetical protein [Thermococcus sp. LS1]NJD99383.1 hypothetical protein [Thermococcus sp. LS1]
MERLKLLRKKLHVVKKQKELLMLEEAKLIRLARQKKAAAKQLAKVKKEKAILMAEEARLVRVLKQNGYPAL